jgi:hypothetical protein
MRTKNKKIIWYNIQLLKNHFIFHFFPIIGPYLNNRHKNKNLFMLMTNNREKN